MVKRISKRTLAAKEGKLHVTLVSRSSNKKVSGRYARTSKRMPHAAKKQGTGPR